MAHHVCPWWLGYFLISPLRRWLSDPAKLLSPYVREGMTVLEPGPGMGFFTLEFARLVGPSGRVVAVDVQPKMLAALKRRAVKAGLMERLDARLAEPDSMGVKDLKGQVDFAMAFAVVHEIPAPDRFFSEVAEALKAGALFLFAEPKGHVKSEMFDRELKAAAQVGFEVTDHPAIRRSRTALLKKL
ncbi:MAG: class I SAM-dependent methyltransferase [Terriglobia bacterium]|jgi:SAM-dependent methyltransferase